MSRFATVAVAAFAVLGAACEKSKNTAEEAPIEKGSTPKALPPPPPKAAEVPKPVDPVKPPVPDPTGGDHDGDDGHGHGSADPHLGSADPAKPPAPEPPAAESPPGSTAPAAPPSAVVAATLPMDTVRAPVASDLAAYLKGIPGKGKLRATIDTSLGAFHCELYEKETPMTVANFVGLATGKKPWTDPKTDAVMKNKPFFNGIIFHRVIPDFMVQTGDPLGRGTGGPGYDFADEIVPSLKLDAPGVLAMANSGPATNGSQFFITEKATEWLTGRHTVFGKCAEVDLVKKITSVDKGPGDRPTTPVVIKSVKILRK